MIENIIFTNNKRKLLPLKKVLNRKFCFETATKLNNSRNILIVTGFYIKKAQTYENDGILGAIFLSRAFSKLDKTVSLILDTGLEILQPIIDNFAVQNNFTLDTIYFPLLDEENSRRFAENLLHDTKADTVIAIEKCGKNELNKYYNMLAEDITEHTAKTDYLFSKESDSSVYTVGIGDGGNEIGMGNLYKNISKIIDYPCITKTDDLIIADTSNWGVYGILGYLSILNEQNLLPSSKEEEILIKDLSQLGIVDGISGEKTLSVDGYSIEQSGQILNKLHDCAKAK